MLKSKSHRAAARVGLGSWRANGWDFPNFGTSLLKLLGVGSRDELCGSHGSSLSAASIRVLTRRSFPRLDVKSQVASPKP